MTKYIIYKILESNGFKITDEIRKDIKRGFAVVHEKYFEGIIRGNLEASDY